MFCCVAPRGCCVGRNKRPSPSRSPLPVLVDDSTDTATHVVPLKDGRGQGAFAARSYTKGEVIFTEPPIAIVFPSHDPPWVAALRQELQSVSTACAWQYCMAVHCLAEGEWPRPLPPGVWPLPDREKHKLGELCGGCSDDLMLPSELAQRTAEHLLQAVASEGGGECQWPALAVPSTPVGDERRKHELMAEWLAERLDDAAGRISRNGFQIVDMAARPPVPADGLFHRISFFNHSCAGLNNASWVWNGADGCISVKTTRDVRAGEELTISYITKPWCDLARPARRRYLKQNFNFVCCCQACTDPTPAARSASGETDAANSGKNGKLANMLLRWMTDDHVGEDESAGAPETSVERNGAVDAEGPPRCPEPPKAKAPLTDEERLERVLSRCSKEGLCVSAEEAGSALEEEGGHVGRAMISLRRRQRLAPGAPPAADRP